MFRRKLLRMKYTQLRRYSEYLVLPKKNGSEVTSSGPNSIQTTGPLAVYHLPQRAFEAQLKAMNTGIGSLLRSRIPLRYLSLAPDVSPTEREQTWVLGIVIGFLGRPGLFIMKVD